MSQKSILMVEDSEDDIKLITKTLKDNHVINSIELARDGVEALDMLFGTGKNKGNALFDKIAMVLLDIKLPKIDGFEVLKRIRNDERTRFLPVVILTSSKQEQDVIEGYKNGCNSFVCKPVEYTEFCKAVHDIGLYWLLFNEPPLQEK